jgi:transketolase
MSEPFIPNNADDVAIATIRTLAVDVVGKANSGHPGKYIFYFPDRVFIPQNVGAPMGMAPATHVLFSQCA